jgi:hypothetical protein
LSDRTAGALAIVAGLCWFAWATANTVTPHGLEQAPPGTAAAIANSALTAGWNLLLIPAIVRLYLRFRGEASLTLLAASAAGTISVCLWALGGLTQNSRPLETTYLPLAALWVLVLGVAAVPRAPTFGIFTLVLGAFTALDAIFNLFEPVPFAIYLLAAPKLPLAACWSVTAGAMLASSRSPRAPGSVTSTMSEQTTQTELR